MDVFAGARINILEAELMGRHGPVIGLEIRF